MHLRESVWTYSQSGEGRERAKGEEIWRGRKRPIDAAIDPGKGKRAIDATERWRVRGGCDCGMWTRRRYKKFGFRVCCSVVRFRYLGFNAWFGRAPPFPLDLSPPPVGFQLPVARAQSAAQARSSDRGAAAGGWVWSCGPCGVLLVTFSMFGWEGYMGPGQLAEAAGRGISFYFPFSFLGSSPAISASVPAIIPAHMNTRETRTD